MAQMPMSTSPITILIVDDTPANLHVLSTALENQGYEVRGVVSGQMALRAAEADPPHLILLDIRMPDMDGFEVCRRLKASERTRAIPVIFLSALERGLDKAQAFTVGGSDYITKPFQLEEVLARVNNQLMVRAAHDLVQEINQTLEQQVQERTQALELANQALRQEIEERRRIEQHLRESEARYRLVTDNISDLVGLHDQQGRFLYVSPSCQALFGCPPTALLGQSLYNWVHPDDRERVQLQFQTMLHRGDALSTEYRVNRPQPEDLWLETLARPITNQAGPPMQFQTVSRDVSARVRVENQLRHRAFYDELTQLPNRTLFMDRVDYALQQATHGHGFAVLLVDLDRFKLVNDSLGHVEGDHLLVLVAQVLKHCLRSVDTLARWGGDEFGLLVPDLADITDAIDIASLIQKQLSQPIVLQRQTVVTSASIGIVWGGHHYQRGEEMLRDADIAMYRAKAQGRACYAIFDPAMHAEMLQRLQLEHELRLALDRNQLQVYYQPQIEITTGKIIGIEALMRWHHPQQGAISPQIFIPIAEETGLILPLGDWILQQTCQQLCQWQHQFPHLPLYAGVNVATQQLQQPDFIETLEGILAETGLAGDCLHLEITENSLLADTEQVGQTLVAIRQHQIRLSIDDFGTGYSSLSYLQRFPVDSLKIDQSFVRQIQPDTGSQSEAMGIIRTILALASSMNMEVVAEGIETDWQLNTLRQLGCRVGQGYWFAPPLPGANITDLLTQQVDHPDSSPHPLSP